MFFGYKFGTAIYDILRMSEAAVVFGETNLQLGKMASKAWWSGLRNEPAYRHFNPKQAAMAAIAFIIGAEVASSVDGEIAGNQGNRVRIGFLAWLAGGVGQAILDYGKLNSEHASAERFGRALLDLRSDIRAQVFGCHEERASAIS